MEMLIRMLVIDGLPSIFSHLFTPGKLTWLAGKFQPFRKGISYYYKKLGDVSSSWWFQPIWKILVKLEIFPN